MQCGGGGGGLRPFQQAAFRPGPGFREVDLVQVLRDLAGAAAIQNFDAKGVKVVVRGPGLEAEQLLPQSRVFYRSPAELHVIGRKFGGKTYAQITVAQDTFLLSRCSRPLFPAPPASKLFRRCPGAAGGRRCRGLFAPEDWAASDCEADGAGGGGGGTFVLTHTSGEVSGASSR